MKDKFRYSQQTLKNTIIQLAWAYEVCWFGLVVALRPHTPKHIRGGWSHYTDTSEPVDGGVQL
jgi:hypothetical protein